MTNDTRPDRRRHFQDPEAARRAGAKGAAALAERRAAEKAALEALPEADRGALGDGVAAGAALASTQDRAIVAKLQAKAQAGDIGAARELREWRKQDAVQAVGRDALRIGQLVSALSRPQLRALHDWLVEQLSPAQEDIREGSNEGDQALPEEQEVATSEPLPPQPRDSAAV